MQEGVEGVCQIVLVVKGSPLVTLLRLIREASPCNRIALRTAYIDSDEAIGSVLSSTASYVSEPPRPSRSIVEMHNEVESATITPCYNARLEKTPCGQ